MFGARPANIVEMKAVSDAIPNKRYSTAASVVGNTPKTSLVVRVRMM